MRSICTLWYSLAFFEIDLRSLGSLGFNTTILDCDQMLHVELFIINMLSPENLPKSEVLAISTYPINYSINFKESNWIIKHYFQTLKPCRC